MNEFSEKLSISRQCWLPDNKTSFQITLNRDLTLGRPDRLFQPFLKFSFNQICHIFYFQIIFEDSHKANKHSQINTHLQDIGINFDNRLVCFVFILFSWNSSIIVLLYFFDDEKAWSHLWSICLSSLRDVFFLMP